MDVFTSIFWNEGLIYANHNRNNSNLTGLRKFKSFYGISPEVFSKLWKLIQNKPEGSEPKHLLWTMLFLKNYNNEHINAAITHVDEKTFRLWVWRFVKLLAELNVVGLNANQVFSHTLSYTLFSGEVGKSTEKFKG